MSRKLPAPKPPVDSPSLIRPDWTSSTRRDPNLLWLDKNENTDPTLATTVKKIADSMPRQVGYCYPDHGPLYKKLADYLKLDPQNIIIDSGSDGLIRTVFEAFVGNGDKVIHTAPTFAMYFVYSKMYGANEITIPYEASKNGPVLNTETLIETIKKERPKAVFLPNPDSPTGTVFSAPDLRSIIEAAGDADAVMLVDEAYHPFYPGTCLPWVTEYPHLLVTRSTGKAWGLAGYRIGYGAASKELAAILHKVKAMYEVGAVPAYMLENMLDHQSEMEASVARLLGGKADFLKAMSDLGLKVLHGEGNFIHVAFGEFSNVVHKSLADLVYYRKDFSEPCLKGYSRFSITTKELFLPVRECIEKVIKA
jgi:histidinol-phosphate aminotransferase